MHQAPSPHSAPAETSPAASLNPPQPFAIDIPGVGCVPALGGSSGIALSVNLSLADLADLERFATREARHEALLCGLIYAARDLARRNLRESQLIAEHEGEDILTAGCMECFGTARGGVLIHAAACSTGRVLRLIGDLLGTVSEPTQATGKETAPAEACAGDGIRPRGDFSEPWQWSSTPTGAMWILDSEETVIARTVSASPRESRDWAERIIACVNFCAGKSDKDLAARSQLSLEKGGR